MHMLGLVPLANLVVVALANFSCGIPNLSPSRRCDFPASKFCPPPHTHTQLGKKEAYMEPPVTCVPVRNALAPEGATAWGLRMLSQCSVLSHIHLSPLSDLLSSGLPVTNLKVL